MTIGQTIKHARKSKGWTQDKLAEVLGVSKTHISLWETGRYFPSIMNFISLADVFDMTIDELVGREVRHHEG